jgi:hypothetical protein
MGRIFDDRGNRMSPSHADIRDHRIDIVVVYKVDRLTRSLAGLRQAGRAVRPAFRLIRVRDPAPARGGGSLHPQPGP